MRYRYALIPRTGSEMAWINALDSLGKDGFRVIQIVPLGDDRFPYALMEQEYAPEIVMRDI